MTQISRFQFFLQSLRISVNFSAKLENAGELETFRKNSDYTIRFDTLHKVKFGAFT